MDKKTKPPYKATESGGHRDSFEEFTRGVPQRPEPEDAPKASPEELLAMVGLNTDSIRQLVQPLVIETITSALRDLPSQISASINPVIEAVKSQQEQIQQLQAGVLNIMNQSQPSQVDRTPPAAPTPDGKGMDTNGPIAQMIMAQIMRSMGGSDNSGIDSLVAMAGKFKLLREALSSEGEKEAGIRMATNMFSAAVRAGLSPEKAVEGLQTITAEEVAKRVKI